MEEVQSWWEVPAVAHFCHVFRSAFNLIFFEIAELESALLNIQDPDMSISLDQLIIRLLQGCYDEESVNENNWEEKLRELFKDNCEDGEKNPFDDSQYFMHMTPRLKIEILLRLCEFRLDVEGALEAIKNIPSEDMQAKCLGKDSQNNTYWYFCDERLYKEDISKVKKVLNKKEVKNTPNKRQVSTREKRTKLNPDRDQPWIVACFNLSDWEKLLKTFSKSKNSDEKNLANAIKKHLPILQETVSEKDRLLRKRFMELAPKRTSSRILKVQEKKKIDEIKAQEEARKAQIEAEKEQARREALKLKEEKESRQKRAEMRHKAIEERAQRAKLREMARDVKSEDSDDDSTDHEKEQRQKGNSKIQRNQRRVRKPRYENGDSDSEEYDSGSEHEEFTASNKRTYRRKTIKHRYESDEEFSHYNTNKRYRRTYSNNQEESRNNQIRVSSRLQNISKTVKYKFDTDESEEESESDEASSEDGETKVSANSQQNEVDGKDQSESNESDDENASDSSNASNSDDSESDNVHNNVKSDSSYSSQTNSLTSANNYSNGSQENNSLPRVKVIKTTLVKSSSDFCKWRAAFGSKEQKLHILNDTYDNLSPKRVKLEQVKTFRTATPNLKSLSKENHIYQPVRQTPFITYGKVIPSSPSIVRLDFRKPPNHQVSS